MKSKKIGIILMFVFIISSMPIIGQAAYNPPTSVGAPKNVAAEYREDGFEKTWMGFDVNVSASDDIYKGS